MDPSIHSDVFARYERCVLEIEHRVDDVRNFTHPSEWVTLRPRRVITPGVHRRVNDAGRHGVEPDVIRRVLQRQTARSLKSAGNYFYTFCREFAQQNGKWIQIFLT